MPKTDLAIQSSTAESTQVDVSIAIVNWNASHFLSPCLRSIYNNGASEDHLEVLIVDNASADGSAELIEAEFPQARVLRNDSNLGFAKATNQAIRLSHGRYVLLLNPDTVLFPSAISAMVSFLDKHPKVAAVGPRTLNSNGQTVESYAPFPGLEMALRGLRLVATASYECLLEPPSLEPKPVDWVCGACMMVRREALDQVGLLDEGFFMYWEETDLCWRLWQHGWEVYYLPEACITHHMAGSSAQADDKVYLNGLLLNEWVNSAHRFLRKHYPLWAWAGFALVAGLYIALTLVLSPIVILVVPSRRQQARSILTTYLRALVKHTRSGVRGLFWR